jgi:L-ascorbate metabolism protein UlaG (beta-lactamase superfamily)
VLVVRNTTVVVELAGLRVLIDPCFAPGLGAPGIWSAGAPALLPESLGHVDVVLVTGAVPGGFDDDGYARLDARGAAVLVPDETTRRRALRAPHTRRVRVVAAGDVVAVGPLVVTASPARPAFGVGTGFHLRTRDGGDGDDVTRGDVALWHTGALPPLDVDATVAGFAADHGADVVLGVCVAVGWRSGGPSWSAGLDDVVVLARRAGASSLVPLGRDVAVAPLLSGVLAAGPTRDDAVGEAIGVGSALRIVDEPAGTWLDLARPGRRARR